MIDDVKINNPSEVCTQIKRINDLLSMYHEEAISDASESASFESVVSDVKKVVSERKNQKQLALEQSKRNSSNSNSNEADNYSQKLQAEILKCESQLRNINHCSEALITVKQDQLKIIKDSAELAAVAQNLTMRIDRLISKIIEAI